MTGGFPQWTYDPARQKTTDRVNRLTPKRGRMVFQMTPGTDEAGASGMYVAAFHYDATYSIKLYFSANNTLKLEFTDRSGSSSSGTWDCTGALEHSPATEYEVKIEYDKTYMKLFIDNIEKINISDTVDFSTCKPFYYALGTDIDGGNAYTSTTFDKPDRYAYIRDDA